MLPRNHNFDEKLKKEIQKGDTSFKRFIHNDFSPRKAYTHTHTRSMEGSISSIYFRKTVLIGVIGAGGSNKRGEISRRKEKQQKGSSKFGELGENRWPSAPMGGLAFRTRNSPSQKTSLRWGDCCPPNPNPPSSSAVWKDRHQDMPPVPV